MVNQVRIVRSVARQFGNPRGPVGQVVASFLNRFNRGINDKAIDALVIQPGDHVLNIGFGGGVGLQRVLEETGPNGRVTGVDISPDMVSRTGTAFAGDVAAGRLNLFEGSVDRLELDDASIDAAYAVNSVYFWPDLSAGIREVQRVLRPGSGRLVVAMLNSAVRRIARFDPDADPPSVEDVEHGLSAAGFVDVRTVAPTRDIRLVVGTVAHP